MSSSGNKASPGGVKSGGSNISSSATPTIRLNLPSQNQQSAQHLNSKQQLTAKQQFNAKQQQLAANKKKQGDKSGAGGGVSSPSNSNTNANAVAAVKKKHYMIKPTFLSHPKPHLATTAKLQLLHQRILLSFVLTRKRRVRPVVPSARGTIIPTVTHSSNDINNNNNNKKKRKIEEVRKEEEKENEDNEEEEEEDDGDDDDMNEDDGDDGDDLHDHDEFSWTCHGQTTLYIIDEGPVTATATTLVNQLALNFRNAYKITKVQVERLALNHNAQPNQAKNSKATASTSISCTFQQQKVDYQHLDPLEHVLIKPAVSYNFIRSKKGQTATTNDSQQHYYDADSQSSRGGAGMTLSLRAASIASNMGELRLSVEQPKTSISTPANRNTNIELSILANSWRQDLNRQLSATTTSASKSAPAPSSLSSSYGQIAQQNIDNLNQRNQQRRKARIQLISKRLAQASLIENDEKKDAGKPTTSTPAAAAMKITIHYELDLGSSLSSQMGGLHVPKSSTSNHYRSSTVGNNHNLQQHERGVMQLPPHIYTTAGVVGDHEGPRCWVPCLDSASSKHRASYEMTIQVTAPIKEGLTTYGFGEDLGISQTLIHPNLSMLQREDQEQKRLLRKRRKVMEPQKSSDIGSGTATTSTKQQSVTKLLRNKVGIDHMRLFKKASSRQNNNIPSTTTTALGQAHVIPPDDDDSNSRDYVLMDNIVATHIWSSSSWMPISTRSLGFAIGPWKVLEDAEYFSVEGENDHNSTTNDELNENGRKKTKEELQREQQQLLQKQQQQRRRNEKRRINGHGIRQLYFAPIYERRNIHLHNYYTYNISKNRNNYDDDDDDEEEGDNGNGKQDDNNNTTKIIKNSTYHALLPNIILPKCVPLSIHQQRLSHELDQSVMGGTVGIPHRALSLMKDILAFPAYRTMAYTQVWIPNAYQGGYSSGSLHACSEVLGCNPFLGGSIMDAGLLPPIKYRLPFYQGGRALQALQARNAIRGWVTAALPLGGQDDVGNGYILTLIESFIMSLYERGYGAHGEGGARGGIFYTKRYAMDSGLNSAVLEFLPVRNVEADIDVAIGGVGAVPVEDRNNDQLWRSSNNGTESHTSAMDEFAVRQVLCKDAVDVLERGIEIGKDVPMPSMGWLGSHLSLSFLSSNASSSSDLGCGALELVHANGGLLYRALKADVFRKIVEGRAGVANFIRLVRAAFIAASLDDLGEKELKLPPTTTDNKKPETNKDKKDTTTPASGATGVSGSSTEPVQEPREPPFIVCVNELLKKKGLTHTLFTRALQNLAGRIREGLLLGTLVDVEKDGEDPRTRRPFVDPEGFPNSFVRSASSLFLRVGVYVESASRDVGSSQGQSAAVKGIQLQCYAEPVIAEGGVAFSGPVTVRVIENEGQFREFVKELTPDGSRRDWGTTFLHAKPVTLLKDQMAASGTIEATTTKDKKGAAANAAFTDSILHGAGYQAIELVRLTNLTPLLWVRVDPMGLYGGRISVVQPDACLAEQLFHDGDAGAQVEAIRCLAERPLRIQGSVKVASVHNVKVSELPVRLLGDCLRGSPALHSVLPHTPVVRVQAALAIAQWQNNKAPQNKNVVGAEQWLGMNLLIQYFKERFYSSGIVMPVKFHRYVLKKTDETEVEVVPEPNNAEGGAPNPNPKEDFAYIYLDSFEDTDRGAAIKEGEAVDLEEDEEYRVRSSAINAIASIRAKDGQTPPIVLQFLETVLEAEDTEMMASNVVHPDDEIFMSEKKSRKRWTNKEGNPVSQDYDRRVAAMSYVPSMLVADALLALCQVNASPAIITDPATGKPVQSKAIHPIWRLTEIALKWLEWELYREDIRNEIEVTTMTGVGKTCHDTIAACAIIALSSLAILRQCTTDPSSVTPVEANDSSGNGIGEAADASVSGNSTISSDDVEATAQRERRRREEKLDEVATAQYYMDIFDKDPPRSDLTRAACAQAIACICCASDRFEKKEPAIGLLTALEFLLGRIVKPTTSPGLRQTIALLMMDACTGKICSMQRVGAIGGRNELIPSAARFFNGPLGASHGGDNGSALLMSVGESTYPAANAVNDGARRGLKLINRVGHPRDMAGEQLIVRVATFATDLWRTINGEPINLEFGGSRRPRGLRCNGSSSRSVSYNGVCSFDSHLRCALLALWQWIWPKSCYAVLRVQAWKFLEGTKKYKDIGADRVMKITEEEKAAASTEESPLSEIKRLVDKEIDRQKWRGDMAKKAYEFNKRDGSAMQDVVAAEQGIGLPLPPIQRDTAFKQGGWIASAAQQRRAKALDGGTAVTKLRLTVKSNVDG